jgi:putative ABC transport system permease protein
MNLAYKDIRHHLGRFALTTLGIGLLLMIVMGMGGIYRGLVEEATLLMESIGADLWVVQEGTRGPFAEISKVPTNMVHRVAAVPGIENARGFVSHTIQRERYGRRLRMVVVGLDWPVDKGEWLPLIAGRPFSQGHYEMIADTSLGLDLRERIALGKDEYTVVGLTRNLSGTGGDGLAFLTVSDSRAVQFDISGEAIRLERSSRSARAANMDIGTTQPAILDRASGLASGIPALGPPALSAVMASVAVGADPTEILEILSSWDDVSVFTWEGERDLLLRGIVERTRKQILLFRTILTTVSAIIMALILYTLTLDKIHEIALLKLIGAPNRVILGLILQQAIVLGMLGYAFAYLIGQKIFPMFPRRVVLTQPDLLILAFIVLGISILASLIGVWRALLVSPNEALSG